MEHKHLIDFRTKPFLEKLLNEGDHVYGGDHELIGRPCFFQIEHGSYVIAVPWGAYIVDDPQTHEYSDELLMVIAYVVENRVEHISAIRPERLIPIDPKTIHARTAYHMIISRNYEDIRKENAWLKTRVKELETERQEGEREE